MTFFNKQIKEQNSLSDAIYSSISSIQNPVQTITQEATSASPSTGLMSPTSTVYEDGPPSTIKDVPEENVNKFFGNLVDKWDKNNIKDNESFEEAVVDTVEPQEITAPSLVNRPTGDMSLPIIKARVHVVEGTDDEGGYNRLLDFGENGEFNSNKPLTEMTVAEAVEFGTSEAYRNYSREVLGRGPEEKPSTPMGKYQVLGTTLAELVKLGIVEPDAKFNVATQEKIGDYLITQKRGYSDYQSGDITLAEFERNLGKEFEGIAIKGLNPTKVKT